MKKLNDEYCCSDNRPFGEWLRKKIKRRGVTLEDVAKGSKISFFRLSNIKNRKTGVRVDMAVDLAKFFNVEIGKMFDELARNKRSSV